MLLHRLKFLALTIALSSCDLHSLVFQGIEESAASTSRLILVYSLNDKERLWLVAKNLSVPVKFLPAVQEAFSCEFLTALYRTPERCGVSERNAEVFELERRLVFVPWYKKLPSKFWDRLNTLSEDRPGVYLVVSGNSEDSHRVISSKIMCNIAVATPLGFNAPTDRYKKCHIRKHVMPQNLLEENLQESNYPKGHSYVANTARYWPSTGNVLNSADVTALIGAYTYLNNSLSFVGNMPIFSLLLKKSDFLLSPGTIHEKILRSFFTGAHFQSASVCFFSRRRPVVFVQVMDTWISLIIFVCCLSCLAVSIVAFTIAYRDIFPQSCENRMHDVVLFLISVLLGRSPPRTIRSRDGNPGLFFVAWMIGVFFLGNYIQNTTTSVQTASLLVSSVQSMTEISQLLEIRSVHLCSRLGWQGGHDVYGSQHYSDHIAILMRQLKHNFLYQSSDCFKKASEGTHVALSICTNDELVDASRWNLAVVDKFAMVPRVSLMHAFNPLRYQHRRVLLAIAKAGLAERHANREVPFEEQLDQDTSTQLRICCLFYTSCCLISLMIFFLELLQNVPLSTFRNRLNFMGRFTKSLCRGSGQ